MKATDWLSVCAQILDVVTYQPTTVHILHNDIKTDNIVFGVPNAVGTHTYQILLIDFGKATSIASGKLYSLTETEDAEYRIRFSHLAPEVIEGENRQTTYSDMYSVGGIFYRIVESGSLKHSAGEKVLLNIAEKCCLVQYHHR